MNRIRHEFRGLKHSDKCGRWTFLGPFFRAGPRNWMIVARCGCGAIKALSASQLAHHPGLECKACAISRANRKHGGTVARGTPRRDRLYAIWGGIKSRCQNPRRKEFVDYGGRGISVCPEWSDSYEAFRDWALANGYRSDLSIDRIDNGGHYEPSNCRWVASRLQALNRRTNLFLAAFGESKTVAEWAIDPRCVVTRPALYARLKRGWPGESAIAQRAKTCV